VNTFAEQAKAYWRLRGPLGEPMARGVDAWAEMQRAYVQWLRESMGTNPNLPATLVYCRRSLRARR
jgi:hypothetical protein